MIKNVKKSIAIFLLIVVMLVHNSATLVYAVPEAPQAPSAPSAPQTEAPAPSAPSVPTLDSHQQQEEEREKQAQQAEQQQDASQNASPTPTPQQAQTVQVTPTSTPMGSGVTQNGQSGDTTVQTGNATNTGAASNIGNTNGSTAPAGSGSGEGSVAVVNSGNGQNSTNDGSVLIITDNNTYQTNNANLSNTLDQSSDSGNNSVSGNNNGNATIKTGDANTSGTIVNAVNTNVDGLMISEFNIEEDHNGDFVLDFAANCISGCANAGSILAKNTGNGQNSTNDSNVTTVTDNNTFQTNDAGIENNLILDANSGYNATDGNNGGNNTIKTGDANISANALTFANTNIAGNVVYGVVNIYGDLVGDIMFPEEIAAMLAAGCTSCGSTNTTAVNSGNGQGSTNNSTINNETNNVVAQTNDAVIDNNLTINGTTGDNRTSGNNQGDNLIKTGNVDVVAQVLNVANTNIFGGNMWLVLVNQAGKWVGKIIGAPEGSNMAASSGTEFTVGDNGEITASNSNNAQNSDNNASVTSVNNNTTVQTNNATVTNNLQLNANTGKNSASGNNGGNNTIETGDVNVVANIVNFVNNNIVGNGKLFVTVVNVFGNWMGDFVAPGQKQEPKAALAQHNEEARGGVAASTSNTSNNNKNDDEDTTTTFYTGTTHKTAVRGGGTITQTAGTNGTAQVAGIHTSVDSADGAFDLETAGKKKIKINMAMVIFIVPLFAVWMVLRRILPKKA